MDEEENQGSARLKSGGSQTLLRGLNVIEAVAEGYHELGDIAARLKLTKSTAYRLAATLVDQRYLDFVNRGGYRLGPKLLQLGAETQRQVELVQVARPYLEALSAATLDTVHLGILDEERALYLDKISGRRRIDIRSKVGERQPLVSTGLGKALLLDTDEQDWDSLHWENPRSEDLPEWKERMRGYVAAGHAYDLEENEDRIRCVAAPVRDASGKIAAAISLSSARQYMDDDRMAELGNQVREVARAISTQLGWVEGIERRDRKYRPR